MLQRIVITNMYGELGGGEMAILDHMRYLLSEGKNVSLILLEDGPMRQESQLLGASVAVFPFQWCGGKLRSLLLLLKRVWQISSLLRKEKAQLVIAYTFNDLIIAGIAARFAGCPLAYRAQGEVFREASTIPKTWLGSLLIPVLVRLKPLIVTTTRKEAAVLREMGVNLLHIHHVYLGVDRIEITQKTKQRNLLRESAGWRDRPVIGIFGRLVQWKGQDTILKVAGELKRRGVRPGVWIVGDASFGDGAEYLQYLKELAEKEDISDDVRFLGFRTDVSGLMAACDVVCHASQFEPFGLVIVEAMMVGRPVVASDVSGPRESVVDQVTGKLVKPGDIVAYADALQELVENPDLREEMGRRARARSVQLFDRQKNLELLHTECENFVSFSAAGRGSEIN